MDKWAPALLRFLMFLMFLMLRVLFRDPLKSNSDVRSNTDTVRPPAALRPGCATCVQVKRDPRGPAWRVCRVTSTDYRDYLRLLRSRDSGSNITTLGRFPPNVPAVRHLNGNLTTCDWRKARGGGASTVWSFLARATTRSHISLKTFAF